MLPLKVKNMNDSKRSYDLGPDLFFKWPRSTSFKSFLCGIQHFLDCQGNDVDARK